MTPFHIVLSELAEVVDAVDPVQMVKACELIAGAGRILAHGSGRERLQLAGFIMRLHHLGLRVAMQGDMAAPPLGPGDLLVCSAGAGDLPTVSVLVEVAQAAGADVLILTATPDAAAAAQATLVLTIPALTGVDEAAGASILPPGSLYEAAMFLLFEVMALDLRDRLAIPPDVMRSRQTNME